MPKAKYAAILFGIAIVLLVGIWLVWSWTNQQSPKSAPNAVGKVSIQEVKATYLSGAKAINYAPAFTGFVLEPYKTDGKYSFSGGVLAIGKDTHTGAMVEEKAAKIEWKEGKWTIAKGEGSSTGSGASKDEQATYELKFIDGFTRMRLLGKAYAFKQENLDKYGSLFDLKLLVDSKNVAYVLSFENAQEKMERQKTFDEYEKKVAEINEKYLLDSNMRNALLSELNKAYGLQR